MVTPMDAAFEKGGLLAVYERTCDGWQEKHTLSLVDDPKTGWRLSYERHQQEGETATIWRLDGTILPTERAAQDTLPAIPRG
jgi:hypothetical protein